MKQLIKVDFDRKQVERAVERRAKKLYVFAEGVLVDLKPELIEKAKGYCPVGPTGNLRESIDAEVVVRDNSPTLRVFTKDNEYAVYVEFGTEDTPEQAFIRPAVFEMGGELKRRTRGRRR